MKNDFWLNLRWKLYLAEYIYRPQQIIRRVRRKLNKIAPFEIVRLPWGLELEIKKSDRLIFNSLWYKGVFDVVSTETIWRLLDKGDCAVDVGANIGYMTSLMAAKVGRTGKVVAFEPHPDLFKELSSNSKLWTGAADCASVELKNVALSASTGHAYLEIPSSWEANRGAAFVTNTTSQESADSLSITLERADNLFDVNSVITLMKFDVEGHEEQALKGAERLLTDKVIRNIVFEDSIGYPSPTMSLLKDYGYAIFSLVKGFSSPRLHAPDRIGVSPKDSENYLATLDVDRALKRMKKSGWMSLKER